MLPLKCATHATNLLPMRYRRGQKRNQSNAHHNESEVARAEESMVRRFPLDRLKLKELIDGEAEADHRCCVSSPGHQCALVREPRPLQRQFITARHLGGAAHCGPPLQGWNSSAKIHRH